MTSHSRRRPASAAARASAPPQRVRIIGGRYKRTPLPVPDLPGLRPTPDRVRETLFNWLGFLRPDFARLRGLDLFAGTGALGFELASRGAAQVTLVEREPRLVAQLQATREKLQAAQVEVLRGDAVAVAARLAPASFDLVFLDPPYDAGLYEPALAAIGMVLAAGGLIYVESRGPLPEALLASHGLSPLRSLQAGQVHACLLARTADLPAPEDG